jgi:hypothetical protein
MSSHSNVLTIVRLTAPEIDDAPDDIVLAVATTSP